MSLPVTVDAVKLSPQYNHQVIVSNAGSPADQCAPLTRQRRRLENELRALGARDWDAPSRCGSWTVRDVVAHLAGVNVFWHASLMAGLADAPTRLLGGFDPAVTPSQMVDSLGAIAAADVLEMFVSSNDSLLGAVGDLDDRQWMALAESPAGHVSIRLVAQHALWDAWVHERDILLPLGITPPIEVDEIRSCLHYAAALSPALALGLGQSARGQFVVQATDPDVSFVLEVADSVLVRDGAADGDAPCLRGDAVQLVEALSIRAPLPDAAPSEWRRLLGGLAAAFDAEGAGD